MKSATPPAAAQFVHDFAGIDLPLATVVQAVDLIATPSLLETLVLRAWSAEVDALQASMQQPHHTSAPQLDVVLGVQRSRSDALIFPLSWRAHTGPWVPPLEADIEFASFGPDRTHVHLYGSSELPPGVTAASASSSLTQRLTVAIVRHVLTSVSRCIVDFANDPNAKIPETAPRPASRHSPVV